MRIAPITISFFSLENSVQLIAQLKEYVSELNPIIVIDNNPVEGEYGFEEKCKVESNRLARNSRVLYIQNEDSPDIGVRSHGLGMDRAIRFCKEYNFDWMLHIEPDCKIFGRKWYDQIIDATYLFDVDLVALYKLKFGPIHPCISLWRVQAIAHSFKVQQMDRSHPRFNELFNTEELLRQTGIPCRRIIFQWDTAQRNWFEAAVKDKCLILENPGDIIHLGHSSKRL